MPGTRAAWSPACDDTAEYFDFYFYVQYLKSLRGAEPPEARLLALHPSSNAPTLAFEDLREAGLLVPFEDRGPAGVWSRWRVWATRSSSAARSFSSSAARGALRAAVQK
jgi:hypothetical protein